LSRKPSPGGWASSPLTRLTPWDASGNLQVLIDTKGGSRTKFKFDVAKAVYIPGYIFPPGLEFPFDFGSIPQTVADDGDPLDVLVLSEEPTFVGCLVPVRPLGVLEARQTQRGKSFRNDRIIGASTESRTYADFETIADVRDLIDRIERFFLFYNESRGRKFEVRARRGPDSARRLIKAGERRFRESRPPK
jgi:inorganic pyrophosphatase